MPYDPRYREEYRRDYRRPGRTAGQRFLSYLSRRSTETWVFFAAGLLIGHFFL